MDLLQNIAKSQSLKRFIHHLSKWGMKTAKIYTFKREILGFFLKLLFCSSKAIIYRI